MTPLPDPPASSTPLPRRRRWLRVSLRASLILVLLVGGGAGWVAHTIRTQRQAVAAVRAAGGQITFDFAQDPVGISRGRPVFRTEPAAPKWLRRWLGDELFQSVTGVRFLQPVAPGVLAEVARFGRLETFTLGGATGLGDGLRHLRGLGRLNTVWISNPGITDVLLGDLAGIKTLRSLTVGRPQRPGTRPTAADEPGPTDAGFVLLAALPAVESLTIEDSPKLTDAGAARLVEGLPHLRNLYLNSGLKAVTVTLPTLARHHPKLRILGLDGSGVTDDDLKAIEGMTGLEFIHLQKTRITDAGVAHLRPLKNLGSLMLTIPGLTDEGLRTLGELPELKSLFLSGSKVTDAGLVHLAGLANLKRLDLDRTLVTDAGMAAVARIGGLEQLGLSGLPGITDAGLLPLRALGNLQRLLVAGTKVTPAGIAALQQAVPSLRTVINQPARRPAPGPAPAAK